jgi:T5SS/PEP-CTERM-associated repeat protein
MMDRFPVTHAAMTTRWMPFCLAFLAACSLAGPLSSAWAAITPEGDVSPALPWDSSTIGYVGNTASGTLTVDSGNLLSQIGEIGYSTGATGVVNISGTGSTWNSSFEIDVGYHGAGTLNITGGGAVSGDYGEIGYESGSHGMATVDGVGSKWTCNYGVAVGNYGVGTLHITNGGTVICSKSDGESTIGYAIYPPSSSTCVATVDGAGSKWINTGELYIGAGFSNATLNITGGGAVSDSLGYLGIVNSGAKKSVVTVDGAGSKWTNSKDLHVGYYSTLSITGGGAVSSAAGYVGDQNTYNISVATVDGAGSKWTNSSSLTIGGKGSTTLNITGGGAITASSVLIYTGSSIAVPPVTTLAIDVGNGSQLTVGTITNNYHVRILAGAKPAANTTYSPISAGTWIAGGNGIYQAVGGKWDATTHEFTVSPVVEGTSGNTVTIDDLSSVQRILIHDSGTGKSGWTLGASFLASSTPSALSLTATAIDGDTLTNLKGLLPSGQAVLGGWNFTGISGYTSGDPVYLSFDIGTGYSRNSLQLWHWDDTGWTPYSASDLTCNGDYASLTVTGFSGYAVSGMPVPEPGTLVFLLAAALGLPAYLAQRKAQRRERG